MVFCARSQDSLLSVSVRRVHVVFSNDFFGFMNDTSQVKPCSNIVGSGQDGFRQTGSKWILRYCDTSIGGGYIVV